MIVTVASLMKDAPLMDIAKLIKVFMINSVAKMILALRFVSQIADSLDQKLLSFARMIASVVIIMIGIVIQMGYALLMSLYMIITLVHPRKIALMKGKI